MQEITKQTLIRLPEAVHERLISEASRNRRSLTAQVTVILEERYNLVAPEADTEEPQLERMAS